MRYAKIAQLIFGVPLLVHDAKMRAILGALGPRMRFEVRGAVPTTTGPRPQVFDDDEDAPSEAAAPCGYILDRGVARIPIVGPLVHRSMGIDALSGGPTSYMEIAASFGAALADANVRAILLEIDSGGGEANGCFDLADEIFAARGEKPIVAVAADWACSGAYLIASAADRVVTTQTGELGSVGVLWCHVDYSKQNEMLGEAVTYLYAGEGKTDGMPDKPLSAAARKRFQEHVLKTYGLFVGKVARNRRMDEDALRAIGAMTFAGDDGVAVGFADEVGTLQQTLDSLADEARPPAFASRAIDGAEFAQTQEASMTSGTKPPAGAEAAGGKIEQPAAAPVDADALRREASAQASTAERARIAAIVDCEEAKGREAQARHLAFATSMSPEDAKAILATAPKAEPTAPKPPNALEAAMGKEKNPAVGADVDASGDDAEAAKIAGNIVALFRGDQKRSA